MINMQHCMLSFECVTHRLVVYSWGTYFRHFRNNFNSYDQQFPCETDRQTVETNFSRFSKNSSKPILIPHKLNI